MISHRAFLIRSEFIYFHLPEEQTSNVTSKALYMQHLTISVMFSFIAKHTKVPSYWFTCTAWNSLNDHHDFFLLSSLYRLQVVFAEI